MTRRPTRSPPIQFRLDLDDYAILQRLATAAGITPKDYVIGLALARIDADRTVTQGEPDATNR